MTRVLIVEDDTTSRQQLEAALARGEFEPVAVGSPDAALAALQGANPPTLVVMDWEMPGVGGLEMLRRLRGCRGGSGTWVLMLAGGGRREDEIAALDAGADDYLVRPVDAARLRAHLRVGARRVAQLARLEAGGNKRGRAAA